MVKSRQAEGGGGASLIPMWPFGASTSRLPHRDFSLGHEVEGGFERNCIFGLAVDMEGIFPSTLTSNNRRCKNGYCIGHKEIERSEGSRPSLIVIHTPNNCTDTNRTRSNG